MKLRPTLDRIRDVLDVNVDTGEVFWRVTRGKARKGANAGRKTFYGYRELTLDTQSFMVHSVIWYCGTGEWPPLIDHINGVRDDNRIVNLRLADAATNARNRTNYVQSKLLGAYVTPQGSYRAAITADGRAYHLGVFATEAEAHQRYLDARAQCALAECLARTRMLEAMQKGGSH